MKNKVLVLEIISLLIIVIFCGCSEKQESYSIQQLIDRASPGDIINIKSGTYNENIIINKKLSLVGWNKENTIINGNGNNTVTIDINAFNVVFTGFTVKNGLFLVAQSTYNNISNNIFENSWVRLYMHYSTSWTIGSSFNRISNNIFRIGGIDSVDSFNNTIDNNTIFGNGQWQEGISLSGGYSNVVSDNTIYNTSLYGIYIGGNSNIITGNIINGNNDIGINVNGADGNIIKNNNIENNKIGIELQQDISNNTIFLNNFINNGQNSDDNTGMYQINPTFKNNFYNEEINKGNYWDDYITRYPNATKNGDIWDTPYKIMVQKWELLESDKYPLVNRVDI